MSERCPHETHVLHAAENDAWTESLRAHVTQCEHCAAAAKVAPWMERLATADAPRRALPDPAIVWLKAHLLRTSTVAQRVSRPMNVFQVVAYIVVAAGWATLLTWKWGVVQSWISGFTPEGIVSGGPAVSVSFFALVFVLTAITVMVALHTILADEN